MQQWHDLLGHEDFARPKFVTYIAELTDSFGNDQDHWIGQDLDVEWKSSQLTFSAGPTTH